MPTPSRALTNDYNACKLIMLEANDPTSPLVVTQEVYAPSDPNFRKRVFYLQRDGMWIDEIAHSTLPHTEAGDIVFETSAEAIEALSTLFGKPLIRDLPVTEADARAFIALVKAVRPRTCSASSSPAIAPRKATREFFCLPGQRLRVLAEVVDSQGRAVPDAVVKVNFQVAGAGDLIGVGNGNPHNVDSFSRPRHYSWHGQALAILRPAKWPGGLMLTASADGLRPARLTLGVKPGRD